MTKAKTQNKSLPQTQPESKKDQDPTVKFNLKIEEVLVKKAYQAALEKAAKTITLKGFRAGKAPLNLVEANVDKAQLYESVLQLVFPPAYTAEVKSRQLKPILEPKVEILAAKETGDWEFSVAVAERPTVSLGDYETLIKKIKPPHPSKKPEAEADHDHPEILNQIFDILLQTSSVSLSSLLIQDEASRSLSRLLEQIEKLGLTLEKYVASLNKTVDEVKAEYQENASATLKLEYILEAIAKTKNLTLTDAEFSDFLSKVTDPQTKAVLEKPGLSQDSVRFTLTKKKVLDYLKSLPSGIIHP